MLVAAGEEVFEVAFFDRIAPGFTGKVGPNRCPARPFWLVIHLRNELRRGGWWPAQESR
jgi:hypothetical protein